MSMTIKKSMSFSLILLCVFGILTQSMSFGASSQYNFFAKTNGTEFSVNNEKFYFMGTNINNLALLPKDGSRTTNDIRSEVQSMASQGLKVIRFWSCIGETFKSDDLGTIRESNTSRNEPMINDDGTFNERALKTLDFTMSELSKNNLKAIFTFVNFEFWQNPMDFFVQKYLGGGPGEKPKELFFTDSRCKEAYKNFVKLIINRKNTVTGILYKDDPTIFAWELCNEPHTSDEYEATLGVAPGTIVFNWLNEMSTFVKSLDKNHMVTTGEEGYRTNGPKVQISNWLNDGLKGVDFERNVKHLPNIDFNTLHVYPDNWAIPYAQRKWVFENYINDRMKIAKSANKPLIIEESGYRLSYGNRDTLLNEIYAYANSVGIAGTMIWSYREKFPDFQMYDFYPSAPGTSAVLRQAQFMNELSKSSRTLSMDSSSLEIPQYATVAQKFLGFSPMKETPQSETSLPNDTADNASTTDNADTKDTSSSSTTKGVYLTSTLAAALLALKKKVGK